MPVIDTNIVIDFLKGYSQAEAALDEAGEKIISVMTLSELLVGCDTTHKEDTLRNYLDEEYRIVGVNEAIAAGAARIRRNRRVKLPDAMILATAFHEETFLITRNIRDFKAEEGKILIPYAL